MKKSVSMSLVVFLALAVVGFAYAAWSGNLSIDGTVTAAKLGLRFVARTPVENPDLASSVDVSVEVNPEDSTQLDVVVSNAVPGYWVEIHYAFHNEGELPVKISDVEVHKDADWLTIDTSSGGKDQIVNAGVTSGDFWVVLQCAEDGELGTTSFTINFTAVLSTGQ